MTIRKKSSTSLLILLACFLTLMVGVVFVDYAWTLYLIDIRWKGFAEIMRRTVFEDGKLGGSDPAVLLSLLAVILYFWSYSAKVPAWLYSLQPILGFIVFASLTAGLGFVHTLKWSLGRVRPHIVLAQQLEYSHWFEFGAHYVTDGIFYGSFPSGHVASVALLFTLSYVLIANPLISKKWQVVGWIWTVGVLAYTVAMIIARCMAISHWISDGLGSFALVVGLMHWLYFAVLRVPEQLLYFKTRRIQMAPFRFWEMRLCAYFFLFAIGTALCLIALNAFQRQSPPWLATLLLPGVLLVLVFFQKARKFQKACTKDLRLVSVL